MSEVDNAPTMANTTNTNLNLMPSTRILKYVLPTVSCRAMKNKSPVSNIANVIQNVDPNKRYDSMSPGTPARRSVKRRNEYLDRFLNLP